MLAVLWPWPLSLKAIANPLNSVYEAIASHFSDTRYKPWPLIPAFLASLPSGSVGADLGCGNGKYLGVRSCLAGASAEDLVIREGDKMSVEVLTSSAGREGSGSGSGSSRSIFMLGIDRSANLVDLAADNFAASSSDGGKSSRAAEHNGAKSKRMSSPDRGDTRQQRQRRRNEVAVGNAIYSCLRTGSIDYAISIATIHHMATWERRRAAVAEMIRIVRPQKEDSTARPLPLPTNDARRREDRQHGSEDYPGLGEGAGRFLIVVWALEQRGQTRRRFEDVAASAGGTNGEQVSTPTSGSDDGAQPKGEPQRGQDVLVPWILRSGLHAHKDPEVGSSQRPEVYQRCQYCSIQSTAPEILGRSACVDDANSLPLPSIPL